MNCHTHISIHGSQNFLYSYNDCICNGHITKPIKDNNDQIVCIHPNRIKQMRISSKGNYVVSVCKILKITFLDNSDSKQITIRSNSYWPIGEIAIRENEKLIAYSVDRSFYIFNIETRECIYSLECKSQITKLSFHEMKDDENRIFLIVSSILNTTIFEYSIPAIMNILTNNEENSIGMNKNLAEIVCGYLPLFRQINIRR